MLKNLLKNGMIVEYTDGTLRIYTDGYLLNSEFEITNNIDNYKNDLSYKYSKTNELDIIKILKYDEKSRMIVIWEKTIIILDEVERNYLKFIINPFKAKVKHIVKQKIKNSEFIKISLNNDEEINFPYFKKDTMYQNMLIDKKYTIEDLKL